MAKEPKFPRAKEGDRITRNSPRSYREKLRSAARAVGLEEDASLSDEDFEAAIREHHASGGTQSLGAGARLTAPDAND
jgi:hypothetical protein